VNSLSKLGVRTYFSPNGIGYGHVGRCQPIARELERRGAEILFSTYLDGIEYVKNLGYALVESPSMQFSVDYNGEVDFKRSTIQTPTIVPRFLVQVNAEIENLRRFAPDIVVSDSRMSTVVAAKALDIPCITILNQFLPIVPRRTRYLTLSKIADGTLMTLLGDGWGLSDRILIPDFPPPNTISLANLRIPRRYQAIVRHVGALLPSSIHDLRKPREIRDELSLPESRKLVLAGISGPREERERLIIVLDELFSSFPDSYHVLMSLGDINGVHSQTTTVRNFSKTSWLMNRLDYLNASELVISRAGHGTIMQSIALGKPSILIPTPGHTEQYSNARRAQELGVAVAIPQEELTRERLLSEVDRIIQNNEYGNNAKRLSQFDAGEGVSNAVEEIIDLAKRR